MFPQNPLGAVLADGIMHGEDSAFGQVRLPEFEIQECRFVTMIAIDPEHANRLVSAPCRVFGSRDQRHHLVLDTRLAQIVSKIRFEVFETAFLG